MKQQKVNETTEGRPRQKKQRLTKMRQKNEN